MVNSSIFSEFSRLKSEVIEVSSAVIDTELHCAEQMIEQAAARIREMLSHAKQELSGVELKVHENILDKCTDLMNYILQLIKQSDQLQREIVEAGRVSTSLLCLGTIRVTKDFRELAQQPISIIETHAGLRDFSARRKLLVSGHRPLLTRLIGPSKKKSDLMQLLSQVEKLAPPPLNLLPPLESRPVAVRACTIWKI